VLAFAGVAGVDAGLILISQVVVVRDQGDVLHCSRAANIVVGRHRSDVLHCDGAAKIEIVCGGELIVVFGSWRRGCREGGIWKPGEFISLGERK
jgi:hypothetical protein